MLSLIINLTSTAQAKIIIPIDIPGGKYTFATGINNAGQIVGYYSDASGSYHGFLLSGGVLITFNVSGASGTFPSGINNSGQIVGEWADSLGGAHGFLRSVGGSISTFDDPSATFGTYPNGINDAGQIVGQYYTQGASHGFLLSGSVFSSFDPLGVNRPEFNGINNGGVIVGDDRMGNWYSPFFLFYGGTYSKYTVPKAIFTRAMGLNNFNQIVGYYTDLNNFTYGFFDSGGGNFSLIDDPYAVPGMSAFQPYGINDLGEIVGNYYPGWVTFTGTAWHGFLLSPVDLIDPVPLLINDLNTPQPFPQQTWINLASARGPIVQGVAADGVTEMLIRIPTRNPGDQFTLTLLNDQGQPSGSADNDGGLFLVGGACCQASLTAPSEATGSTTPFTAYAFALYRAPKDFVRGTTSYATTDAAQSSRNVYIQIERGGAAIGKETVKIVRPPVALIHGIWSEPDAWRFFKPLDHDPNLPGSGDPRFVTERLKYVDTNYLGFYYNAGIVLGQLRAFIKDFKKNSSVAAVQADVVAHSMGGDITRTMLNRPQYFTDHNYYQGDVHKLITLDTPHNGTPLATNLYYSNDVCKYAWAHEHRIISDAVRDLIPSSPALQGIRIPSANGVHLQAHLIAGIAYPSQESTVQNNYHSGNGIKSIILETACPSLLSDSFGNYLGFEGLMGLSDLTVPVVSQEANGPNVGVNGARVPFEEWNGYIHSLDPLLLTIGPDIMNRNYDLNGNWIESDGRIPNAVIGLLNNSILQGQYFGPILP